MRHRFCALIASTSILVTSVGTAVVPALARIDRAELLAVPSYQEGEELPEGVSAALLAGYEVAVEYPGTHRVEMLLEWVPLDPGDDVDGRDPEESGGGNRSLWASTQRDGMHLLYVDTGEVVVATADGEEVYRQGESVFIPASAGIFVPDTGIVGAFALPYTLRNDTGDCAAVLRLSVYFVPFEGGATPAAPSGPERGCGEYKLLLFTATDYPWPADPPAELPIQLFIERLSWEHPTGWHGEPFFPGPVALAVESGTFSFWVGGESGMTPDISADVPVGGQVVIKAGAPLAVWGDEATAILVVGIAPAG